MTTKKVERRIKIKFRIRKNVNGTVERPRLSVFRSNKQIYAQAVDDLTGKTLCAASSLAKERAGCKGGRVVRRESQGGRNHTSCVRP